MGSEAFGVGLAPKNPKKGKVGARKRAKKSLSHVLLGPRPSFFWRNLAKTSARHRHVTEDPQKNHAIFNEERACSSSGLLMVLMCLTWWQENPGP